MFRFLAATALAGALAFAAAPAHAALVDWNFGQHPGLLGDSQTFSAGAFSLTARGFDNSDIGTRLFSNIRGGDESGLGLNNDPTGDEEISLGKGFVQLNLDGLLSKLKGFEFAMNSTTQGEGWKVFGSEDTHPFQFTLLAQSSGLNDESLHTLQGGFDNYSFFYSGPGPDSSRHANVLLGTFEATTAVPEPSTWAMGIVGFGLLAGLGLHKSRKGRLTSIA